MATMVGRESQLERTIETVINQFDKIRVVCNGMTKPPKCLNHPKIEPIVGMDDMTDNGKMFGLEHIGSPENFFTLDDDILYPSNYVKVMTDNIRKFHSIVTCHGRVLNGQATRYYRDHKFFHCAHGNDEPRYLDVCGTGVTAFDTRYFHPKGLATHPIQRMSDIIFSHEAAKANRKIVLIPKAGGWIEPQRVESSIYQDESKTTQETQNELCRKILKLNR